MNKLSNKLNDKSISIYEEILKANKLLGSHNSCTYAKPRKWWQWVFKPIAKCQSLTIEEQFNIGIRAFDFRVRLCNKRLVFAHGLVEYDINPASLLSFLNEKSFALQQAGQYPIYIYLTYETKFFSKKPSDLEVLHFKNACRAYSQTYSHLVFAGGQSKPNWDYLYHFNTTFPYCSTQCSSTSPNHPKSPKTWLPSLFAKHNNLQILQDFSISCYKLLLYDFVGVYPKAEQ